MRFLLILLGIFLSANLQAQISDPKGLLPISDAFLGHVDFDEAFQDKDAIRFTFTECLGAKDCAENTQAKEVVVDKKSSSEVHVNQFSSAGVKTSTYKVTKGNWDLIEKNFLRAKINQLASFSFQIEILKAEIIDCPTQFSRAKHRNCLAIDFTGKNNSGLISDFHCVLQDSRMGIAQILSYQQKDSGWVSRTIHYKLIELK